MQKRIMWTAALVVAAAGLGITGTVVAAPPAQAASGDCQPGNACVFEGAPSNGSNRVVAHSVGNMSPGYVTVDHGFVWNHGTPCSGCDSIELFTSLSYGAHTVTCLVNGDEIEWDQYPGDHPTAYLLLKGERVDKVIWRSHCNSAAYEDRTGVYE